jgi:hypothetical protein
MGYVILIDRRVGRKGAGTCLLAGDGTAAFSVSENRVDYTIKEAHRETKY